MSNSGVGERRPYVALSAAVPLGTKRNDSILPGWDALLLSRGERYLPQQHVVGLLEIRRLRVRLAIAFQRSCRPVDLNDVPVESLDEGHNGAGQVRPTAKTT